MRQRRFSSRRDDKIKLQTTSMNDIVFLLLIFFIMSFVTRQLTLPEGDLGIKMPQQGEGGTPQMGLPIRIVLKANGAGYWTAVRRNGEDLATRPQELKTALRSYIVGILGNDRGPSSIQDQVQVVLAFEDHLLYSHLIEAITAVSGDIDPNTRDVIRLVENVSLARAVPGE